MVEVGYSNSINNVDEEVSSTTSDDFIVVSKVFDLNTPLDEREIRRRLQNKDKVSRSVVQSTTPSAFSMHVEQLKLEQQQQQQEESSDSSCYEDDKENNDDGEEEQEVASDNIQERYL